VRDRPCGQSPASVTKLLVDAGNACLDFHHDTVRNITAKNVQRDEIWAYAYAKSRNLAKAKAAPYGAGDVWTWTGIDADTKLIISWYVGDRNAGSAIEFMGDLRARLANKVQLTTDGHKSYLTAVRELDFDADYAMLIKLFGPDHGGQGKYSPPVCIGTKTEVIQGNPDPRHVNTSFAERQNLTMRMSMRRFTRLTNGFSKKFENHCHALAIYFVWYNWIRVHATLGKAPAMAAGLIDRPMTMAEVVALIEASEAKLSQAA
jgi:IS1 family transposase